ncbi:helix-turn-helix transcriptional regulator [Enterobacteriaceae bacterium RIT714]|jgi:DNA-binding CsgD family transcriptional regulator|uniref:helix-turn-helix transcriptional regulator n=1 Tax=Lelliottia sp. CFBP8978 TaxID=3096522 RepID=UPI0012ACCAEB|nr:LuxR family transcriptional regulator [Lelliottia sp. CFBP8978]MDY1037177.1 LuxR C-terminal-related transcriptional regulator [Lelliottia sp. CFBP8978]MRS90558.1 helix-turn-helix transcriptional regulator [Enterobacteriaceae bacterium RIT714]
MTIYGKDRLFIYGIEKILKQLRGERGAGASGDPPCVYVTSGMDIQEMYSLFFSSPPEHHAIFITSERYFDSLNRLFPGLLKLCLSEKLTVDELRQALRVMSLLSAQNQSAGYLPDTFKFTNAEQQIMRLILRGHSLDDIARIRGVSPTTVSVQRNGLMKRMGTKSLQELCSLYSAMRTQ